MQDNLVDLMNSLTEFERAFIVRRLVAMGETGVHLGTLPFVHRKLACKALRHLPATSPNPEADYRKAKYILAKIEGGDAGLARFQIQLDDAKVFKWSYGNSTTKRIVRLPFKKTVGAGIRWNHFKRKWEKPDTEVHEQALMTRVSFGLWDVEVRRNLADMTKNYLVSQYGAGFIKIDLKPKKKKPKKKGVKGLRG
jgi:hypothetical protein